MTGLNFDIPKFNAAIGKVPPGLFEFIIKLKSPVMTSLLTAVFIFFIFMFLFIFICTGFLRTTEQTSTSTAWPYSSAKRRGRCKTVKAFKQNLYANPTKVSQCALLCCVMEEGVVDGRGGS